MKETWLIKDRIAWNLTGARKVALISNCLIVFYDKDAGEGAMEFIEFETAERAARCWEAIVRTFARNGTAIIADAKEE